jgi:tetratricopeptide (TPR) repeat protein
MADPYDGEIAYADELVGRLFDRLKARGLFDRAVIALVSDHGEGLNDHGEAEHGIFLYREALHVPGILRLPAAAAGGRRAPGTLGEVDVAATLLDLAGLTVDGLDGASVARELGAARIADRTVYSETFYPRLHFGWSDLAAASDGRYRFIRAPRPELFDLAADPRERTNLAAGRQSTAAALDAWIARAAAGTALTEPAEATAAVRERLRALGYIGSSRAPIVPPGPLRDPKDGIAAFEALKRAQAMANQGRHADAAAALERLVTAEPRMLDAWESLAKSRIREGRTADAIAAFGKVLELEPLKPETHLALARIYALEGQPARAREHAELAVERDPAAADEILASLAMDEGRLADASAFARRSVEVDASRYMSHFVLGVIAQRQGRCDQAIGDFTRAIDAKRAEPNAVVRNLHAGLADCLARVGRQPDAEREFRAELSAIPWSPEGRVGLATLYRSQGRDQEARATLAGLVTSNPQPSAESYWTVVHTFAVLGDGVSARDWTARAHAAFPRDSRFR